MNKETFTLLWQVREALPPLTPDKVKGLGLDFKEAAAIILRDTDDWDEDRPFIRMLNARRVLEKNKSRTGPVTAAFLTSGLLREYVDVFDRLAVDQYIKSESTDQLVFWFDLARGMSAVVSSVRIGDEHQRGVFLPAVRAGWDDTAAVMGRDSLDALEYATLEARNEALATWAADLLRQDPTGFTLIQRARRRVSGVFEPESPNQYFIGVTPHLTKTVVDAGADIAERFYGEWHPEAVKVTDIYE